MLDFTSNFRVSKNFTNDGKLKFGKRGLKNLKMWNKLQLFTNMIQGLGWDQAEDFDIKYDEFRFCIFEL